MRIIVMLLTHQLTSHGIDPAFVEIFWILAGSIGAVIIISIVWRVLRMALFFISWAVVVTFLVVVFGHLALKFL